MLVIIHQPSVLPLVHAGQSGAPAATRRLHQSDHTDLGAV